MRARLVKKFPAGKSQVLYGAQKSPPSVPTVNYISPVHAPTCFLKIHFKIIPIYAYVFQVVYFLRFPH